ncbi:hypothetical protein [Streptomyces silvensis]|uniref:hypothetical protein n=1 Tax=Streptomyces silvensis TaxID=1765722 RepID=UPI000B06122A|nr:hypothetical protein [Streptomyces silvensis]
MRRALKRWTAAVVAVVALSGGLAASAADRHGVPSSAALSVSEVDALARMAQNHLQTRASMVTAEHPPLESLRRSSLAAATPSMADRAQDDFTKLVAMGEAYEDLDGGYTKAVVDVSVVDSSVDGDTATLRVTEDTRLHHPFTAAEVAEGAPEFEELSLPHTMKFIRGARGGWLLASDVADVGVGPTPSTQLEAAQ